MNDNRLGKSYQDRFLKFSLPKVKDLPKYAIQKEDEYIAKIQTRRKRILKFISSEGIHLTFRMWKNNSKTVRALLDVHSMTQVGNFNCNILWTSICESLDLFNNLHDYQWVNHFPYTKQISDKKDLYLNYIRMQAKFGAAEYSYHPPTFMFPEEYEEFTDCLDQWQEQSHPSALKKWIFKPNDTCSGFGIFIFDATSWKTSPLQKQWENYKRDQRKLGQTQHAAALQDSGSDDTPDDKSTKGTDKPQKRKIISGVICEYLDDPLLYKGYKFDLRIYVAITSFYPLKIYIYREGLARLATAKYIKSDSGDFNKQLHLTNTCLNKNSKHKSSLKQYEDDVLDYAMSFSAVFNQLKAEGIDVDLIWGKIYDLIIKATLSIENYVSGYTKEHFQNGSKCFELFGYDIMIDNNLKPWLLEVNLAPSLALSTKLEETIKINLAHDLFNLVGIRKLTTAK